MRVAYVPFPGCQGAFWGGMTTKEGCDAKVLVMCGLGGGTAKADVCKNEGAYCDALIAVMGASCATDADCRDHDGDAKLGPRPCCTSLKSLIEKNCDGVDAATLAASVRVGPFLALNHSH